MRKNPPGETQGNKDKTNMNPSLEFSVLQEHKT